LSDLPGIVSLFVFQGKGRKEETIFSGQGGGSVNT
jgi:hypothetical protein